MNADHMKLKQHISTEGSPAGHPFITVISEDH